ncbi:hypothetical protein KP509_06G076000 [Ceratopteris richardii]|nr:hypothetical protein KP509_06G076000 [Ceratopteris richardii]
MSSPTRNRARKELLPSMQIVSTELPETAVFGVVGDGDKLLNEHKAANHPHAETLSFENINTQCRLIYPDRNCIRDVVAGGDASNKDCIAPILDESLLSAEGQMKQMQREALYAAAAMQPIDWTGLLAMSVGARPKRRNVRISHDPQTASARKRRERISERIRVLQRMVPGGTKMDTASMLDEAIHYLKYLKSQIQALEYLEKRTSRPSLSTRSVPFAPCLFSNLNISNLQPSPSSTLIS